MRIVYLTEAGASGTRLGAFLEALMRTFDLPSLLHNMSRSEMQSNYAKWGDWTPQVKAEMLGQLAKVERVLRESGLPAAKGARTAIERIERDDPQTLKELGTSISALRTHIIMELEDFVFLEIPQSDVSLYSEPSPFGNEVSKQFEEAVYDIEEAAKCLALDRGTACVLHLMRAMEMVMHKLAANIGATFKASDQWDTILNEMDRIINNWGYQTDQEVRKKDQYREIHATLTSVKRAWRHPGMHARFTATPEIARDIFHSVGGFMRQFAVVI